MCLNFDLSQMGEPLLIRSRNHAPLRLLGMLSSSPDYILVCVMAQGYPCENEGRSLFVFCGSQRFDRVSERPPIALELLYLANGAVMYKITRFWRDFCTPLEVVHLRISDTNSVLWPVHLCPFK